MTQVTEADRLAAAASDCAYPFADEILAGGFDNLRIVQAFAHHRIQARKDALEEAAVYLISYNEDALAAELRNLANEVE